MKTVPNDKMLEITLRSIGDAVISCDHDGWIVLMNPVAEQLTGWTEEEAMGHQLTEIFVVIDETTRLPVQDPVKRVIRIGAVAALPGHTLLLRRDGTEVPIDDSAAPVLHPDGSLRGVVLVFRDITLRRRAEWSLELLAGSGRIIAGNTNATAILAGIAELASHHFCDVGIFDLQSGSGAVERVIGRHHNPEYQDMVDELHRFTPARKASAHPTQESLFTGKSVLLNDITDDTLQAAASSPEHLAFLREKLKPRSVLAVPIRGENESLGALTFVRHQMGTPFTEEDRVLGEELGLRLGLALKTARLEEQLKVQAAQLTAIIASIPVGIIVAEPSGKIVLANRSSEQILGHPAIPTATLEEHEAWVAYHPDGRRLEVENYPLVKAISTGKIVPEAEFRYEQADGSKKWVTFAAVPMLDEQGIVTGGVVVIADIDQQKRNQQMLERSEERFRVLIERASVGLAIGTTEGTLSYLNPTLLHLLGYSAEEVTSGTLRWNDLTPARYNDADARAMQQLEHGGVAVPYEKAYRAKDGRLIPLLIGASVIPKTAQDGKSADIAVFATDLSMQKRAEAALLQTEKLAAVGKLASSISHEINNPLEAVTNLLFIARSAPELALATRDVLDAADRELARVSQVTSQTLRFHRQSTAPMKVRPELLVEEVIRLYGARLKNAGVTVTRDIAEGTEVTCYEGDIRQVLNNLIGNAVDAMRQGGTLTVRTRTAHRWSNGQAGVRITIADTGCGMTAETRARIFDAFFTTKGANGTGLGLWISCRIVHKHRGYVRAYSSTSPRYHGTVFALWLPLQLADTAREPWHTGDGEPG